MADDLKCCIGGCQSSKLSSSNLSFHRIPRENFGLRQAWVDIIRASRSEPEWFPFEDAVVCSLHFLSNEIVEIPGLSTSDAKLDFDSGKNIVPSLLLGASASSQNFNKTNKPSSQECTFGTSPSNKDAAGSSGSSSTFVPVRIKQEPVDDDYGGSSSYYNDNAQPGSSKSGLGKRTKPTWSLRELSDDEGESRRRPRRNADSDSSEYEPSSSEEVPSSAESEVDEAGERVVSKSKKRRTSFSSSKSSRKRDEAKVYGNGGGGGQRYNIINHHQSKPIKIAPAHGNIVPIGTTILPVNPNYMTGKGPSFLNFQLKGNNIRNNTKNNHTIIFNSQTQLQTHLKQQQQHQQPKTVISGKRQRSITVNPQILSHLENTRKVAPDLRPLNKVSTPELFLMEKVDQIKTLNQITKSDTENYSKCLIIFDQIFKRLSSHPASEVKKLVTIQLSHLLEIVKQRRDNGNSRANQEKLFATTNRIHTYLRAWPTPSLINHSTAPTPTVISSTQAAKLLSSPHISKHQQQQLPQKNQMLPKLPDGLNINYVRNNNNNFVLNSNGGSVPSLKQVNNKMVVASKQAPVSKLLLSGISTRTSNKEPDVISIDDDDDSNGARHSFSPVIESVSTIVKKMPLPPLPKLNSIAKSNQLTITPTPARPQQQSSRSTTNQQLVFNEVIPDPCSATNPYPPKQVPSEQGDAIPWMGFIDPDGDFLSEEPVPSNMDGLKATSPVFPLGKYPPNTVIVVEKSADDKSIPLKNGRGNGLNNTRVPTSHRNATIKSTMDPAASAIISFNNNLSERIANPINIVPQNIVLGSNNGNKNEFSDLLKAYANKNKVQNNLNNQQLLGHLTSTAKTMMSQQSVSSKSDDIIILSDSDDDGDKSNDVNPFQDETQLYNQVEEVEEVEQQQDFLLESDIFSYAQNSINISNNTAINKADYLGPSDSSEMFSGDVEDVQPIDYGIEFQDEAEEEEPIQNNDFVEEEEEVCLLGI